MERLEHSDLGRRDSLSYARGRRHGFRDQSPNSGQARPVNLGIRDEKRHPG